MCVRACLTPSLGVVFSQKRREVISFNPSNGIIPAKTKMRTYVLFVPPTAGRYVVKAFYEVQSSEDPVRTAWLKEFAEDTLATGALGWVRLDWPSRVTSLHPPPLAACLLLLVPPRCLGSHHNLVVGCVFAVVPLCASPCRHHSPSAAAAVHL